MMPKSAEETAEVRTRVRIDFSPDAADVLMRIKTRSGTASTGEVVRDALRLYDWFLDQQAEKASIHVVRADGTAVDVEFVF